MSLRRFFHQIEEATGGDADFHDVLEAIRQGEARAWINRDGLVITQIEEGVSGRGLRYWIAAGTLEDCLALLPDIEEWAERHGCTYAAMTGRKGWARILPNYGWEVEPTVNYRKRL